MKLAPHVCSLFHPSYLNNNTPTGAPPTHAAQVLVPMASSGVRVVRPLLVFGYDDAPHGHAEVEFSHVRVPRQNIILVSGKQF